MDGKNNRKLSDFLAQELRLDAEADGLSESNSDTIDDLPASLSFYDDGPQLQTPPDFIPEERVWFWVLLDILRNDIRRQNKTIWLTSSEHRGHMRFLCESCGIRYEIIYQAIRRHFTEKNDPL